MDDMTGVAFRTATAADWPQVAALLSAVGLPLDGVEAHIDDFVLAERDGAVVGCAGLERYSHAALLRSVAVRADSQGRGLGEVLVHRVLAHAVANGVETVALLTTTAPGFFPRFGFRAVERAAVPAALQASVEFRAACPASATAMVLDVRQAGLL
jgi:N-acetylglutamate synthase-like GNAT family acetyltransferase